MEEKSGTGSRPLRSTANKMKDLYNTYIRNEESHVRMEDKQHLSESDKQDKSKDIEVKIESAKENLDDQVIDSEMVLELVEKFDKTVKERDELKDQLKRLAAEMENIRRRTIKEKQEMVDYANERLLFKMLPLMDDFSAAIEAGSTSTDYEALLRGIELIASKLEKVFEEAGVVKMADPVGAPFNVDFHDAMMHIPSEAPEDNVIQVIQPGYMIGSKVLRHARVITSAGQHQTEANE